MMYQAIFEEEIRHHLRDMHREADKREQLNTARQAEANSGLRKFQQLQDFVNTIVLFLIALAVGSTAVVLDGAGNWVYWVLSIWAAVLVAQAIKIFAPESDVQAECCSVS